MVSTKEFVGELHAHRITKRDFARAHGVWPQELSQMLKCPALPDEFAETLKRMIAERESAEVSA